ncbi:tRNA (adenine(22)-N(1))-methyltransferase [Salibacterium qingdaonense]|uniref:tRNA (Adenine22-N1)-methyltransferase n=1 Tax=Salibacterium qingdaonense TaxID=266892 RepID=A0A1I4JJD8_9BACI|nr:tRNA (adenine(22)-N(1))-methyltransferase TrmK [Salibacterium qingdaonense]SFL66715.1 tRNA (adenine22-N1)-methyltransferase [Salibacterium qingdaonense]
MNHDNVTKRLRAVAGHIRKGSVIADIGTDHGAIPIFAVKHNAAASAVAADVNEGPLAAARANIIEEGLENRIQVRSGNGLHALHKEDDVDTIVISGMGGILISTILEEGSMLLSGVEHLILQPNVGAGEIRRWLRANGWKLESEEIIEENTRIYEILTAVPGEPDIPYSDAPFVQETELLFGPFLMKEHNDTFIKKWTREKEEWERVLRQLKKAEQPEQVEDKKQELRRKIRMAEEVLPHETS